MNYPKMRIAIDGNIGAGKSSIMRELQSRIADLIVVNEPIDEWTNLPNPINPCSKLNLLESYYSDTEKFAFAFQILVQNTFAKNCIEKEQIDSPAQLDQSVVVTERTLGSSYAIFGKNALDSGFLTIEEYSILMHHAQFMAETHPKLLKYDLYLYIHCKPEECLKRIEARKRPEETNAVSLQYLNRLHAAYDNWFEMGCVPLRIKKLIRIDANGDLESTIDRVMQVITNNQKVTDNVD